MKAVVLANYQGLGGWATITDVKGKGKKYSYTDADGDWVAYEWTKHLTAGFPFHQRWCLASTTSASCCRAVLIIMGRRRVNGYGHNGTKWLLAPGGTTWRYMGYGIVHTTGKANAAFLQDIVDRQGRLLSSTN